MLKIFVELHLKKTKRQQYINALRFFVYGLMDYFEFSDKKMYNVYKCRNILDEYHYRRFAKYV